MIRSSDRCPRPAIGCGHLPRRHRRPSCPPPCAFHSQPLPTRPALSANRFAAFKRYVIVRDIPDIAQKNKQELGAISGASCTALSKAGLSKVQVNKKALAETLD